MTNSYLDPESDPRDSPDSPEDNEPDTVSTPEGDAEGDPDAPLNPGPDGLQTPPLYRHQQAVRISCATDEELKSGNQPFGQRLDLFCIARAADIRDANKSVTLSH